MENEHRTGGRKISVSFGEDNFKGNLMKKIMFAFCISIASAFFICAAKEKEEKLDLKRVKKSMAKVMDNVYACKYEATNLEYRIFLNELKANYKNDDYKIAEVDTAGWKRRFKYAYMDPLTTMYSWHPAYDNYPVVNVSFEGAALFCNWLTEKYNSWNGRAFKKVKFRLPSHEEWELAARGGKKGLDYPTGNQLIGDNGRYRCNYQPLGDERIKCINDTNKFEIIKDTSVHRFQFSADGATYTVSVNAYLPNGFGLYNASGNAAEMVLEKGIARGGSWWDTGYNVRIDSRRKYENTSPMVGFRYFMEVIEK